MEENGLIERFNTEVLETGPESTLPSNLSDEWLGILSKQAEEVLEGSEDARITELLAAIIHILVAKNGFTKKVSIEESRLFEYFETYRIELALEEVSRRTEVKSEAATLDSIFTNRSVEIRC